jgi:hypothetical protein
VVSAAGTITLGGKVVLAAEILAGRRVGIRIEPATPLFFDLDTRELLRTRPNPLTPEQLLRLRGQRPLDHHPDQPWSRCESNASPTAPESCPCAGNASDSDATTPGTP